MHEKLILDHLRQLVSFYPKSDDQTAVRQALVYCQEILRQSGNFPDVTLHKQAGFYSLTASTRGIKHPKLLLSAHIDVVPAAGRPSLKVDKGSGLAGGRGVYDMLFATACYLAFIQTHQAGLSKLDIGIMLVGDEELGGDHGTYYLMQQGYSSEVCVLPDAGKGFGDLSIAAKGVYNFDLTVHGRSHHGSRPWEGDGAANKLVHMLHELLQEFDDSNQENSTMTVTRLNGGDANNQGPSQATAHLDIRYKDAADFARIQKVVARLCVTYDAETQNMLLVKNLALDVDSPHLRDFIGLYEQHAGQAITYSKAHGNSDARFFAAQGIPVIMFRPDGFGAHSDHEGLSLASLQKFYGLLEAFILTAGKH